MRHEARAREPGTHRWRPVYGIVERDGKTYWPRLGVAFDNSDGSVTLKLEALPVNGQLQIRDRRMEDEPRRSPRILRVHGDGGSEDLVGG